MATLLERISGESETVDKIGVHSFVGDVALWAIGAPGFTRASIISEYAITAEQESELDALVTAYQAATNKVLFIWFLERLMIQAEEGRRDMTTPATFSTALTWLGNNV